MRSPVLVALLLAAARPAASQAPLPPPSFPASVEQVTVDVVVADRGGAPVEGLRASDFVVLEDGVAQTLTAFEAVTVPEARPQEVPELPAVSRNTDEEDRRGRTFLVVFDDVSLTRFASGRAKAAIASFIESGARPGDRVTLVSTTGAAWWTARLPAGRAELLSVLRRLEGRYVPETGPERMTDAEAMRITVLNDRDTAERVARRFDMQHVRPQSTPEAKIAHWVDPYVAGRAAEVYGMATNRLRVALGVMERAVRSLADVRGRKAVLLVSQGFYHDPGLLELTRVAEACRQANAAVYFLDARGLDLPAAAMAEWGYTTDERDTGFAFLDNLEAASGAEALAVDTGGFSVSHSNDLGRGFTRIAQESSRYYLLGYESGNTARDGRYRRIEVRLAGRPAAAAGRGDLQLRARRGYYAPATEKEAPRRAGDPDPRLQAALDSPRDLPDIPLRLTAHVFEEATAGKAQTLVTAEVDVRALALREDHGRSLATLECLFVAIGLDSGESFRRDRTVEMNLLPATRERLLTGGFPIAQELDLAPGSYQARFVVRDKATGRIGSVTHPFLVPGLRDLRTSTPVLSDLLLPAEKGQPARPAVVARREFRAGGKLYLSVEVYGARKAQGSLMPSVAMGCLIRRPDGAALVDVPPVPMRPTSLGSLSRQMGFSLADAAPGEYTLVLTVVDSLAGTTVERRESFVVLPPLSS